MKADTSESEGGGVGGTGLFEGEDVCTCPSAPGNQAILHEAILHGRTRGAPKIRRHNVSASLLTAVMHLPARQLS